MGDNPVIKGDKATRNYYISYADGFRNKIKGISGNMLLDLIKVEAPSARVPYITLTANTGGFSAERQELVKDAWSELVENPDTKEIGKELFFANVQRSGFDFSPKTFLHQASVDTKLNIDGYVEAIRDINFNSQDGSFLHDLLL